MASMREIKNRINSVNDTRKITSAMYLIASTKMRKAKEGLDNTRPYFDALRREIRRIFSAKDDIENAYFYPHRGSHDLPGTYGYLVITADKGLAGAYNQSVIKEAMKLMSKHDDNKLFVVGEYGRHYFQAHNIEMEKSFLYTAQNPTLARAGEIAAELLDMYDKGELTKIFIIYTDLVNSMSSSVASSRLLPLSRGEFIEGEDEDGDGIIDMPSTDFEFYPNMVRALDSIIPSYLTGFIYSALVDSFCSEQNERMMAMDSANKNAEKLLEELSILYNHVRQNAITQEITEVSSGAKAKRKKLELQKKKKKNCSVSDNQHKENAI